MFSVTWLGKLPSGEGLAMTHGELTLSALAAILRTNDGAGVSVEGPLWTQGCFRASVPVTEKQGCFSGVLLHII